MFQKVCVSVWTIVALALGLIRILADLASYAPPRLRWATALLSASRCS